MRSNLKEMDSTQKEHLKKAKENSHYDELQTVKDSRAKRAKRIMKRKPYYLAY